MANNWSVSRVRKTFCDYFVERGHTFVPSSPVVPLNDPTLLFANAGMNQFKKLFLGTADPSTEFGRMTRAANSQLCIRAGGKQNDLEDVGRDTYHHTFFEMLGSWSFGSYGKVEAIDWAWDLMTRVYNLPKDRLYVTYCAGSVEQGVAADEETRSLWARYVDESRILPGSMKDNFWEMGDTGPCGPCTEIHYDRIGGRDAAHLVNHDDPTVIELWNLVFMQFDRRGKTTLVPLPRLHVDTGMGLERITAVLQNKMSNYDTDSWTPLFDAIRAITKFPKAYDSTAPNTDDVTVAYRVVADHARCVTVALLDGAVPDAVGRGFVLRRIIRRAIRYGSQFLGAEVGFLSQLVDVVAATLQEFFPSFQDAMRLAKVKSLILREEESFARTWQVGLKHFENAQRGARERDSRVISAADAFVLHDRYGFPVDLTALLAEKVQMTVDVEGFQAAMKANQAAGKRVAATKAFLDPQLMQALRDQSIPITDDSTKYTWKDLNSTVVAVVFERESSLVEAADFDCGRVGIISQSTPFYAESGGQIFDTGLLQNIGGDEMVMEVECVHSYGGYVVHIGEIRTGRIAVGDTIAFKVNYDRRKLIASNHTATHAINWCLRRVLEDGKPGEFNEINQKGSLVTDTLLRFDFSYNSKLLAEDIVTIDGLLNAMIQANPRVFRKVMPLAEAMTISGLRFMKGENYPDPVAVLSVGADFDEMMREPQNTKWREFPIELCGGTHLAELKDAEVAAVISEEALMNGVRRIVVYTGEAARVAARSADVLEQKLAAIVNTTEGDTTKALSVLAKEVNDSDIPLIRKNTLRANVDAAFRVAYSKAKGAGAASRDAAALAGAAAADAPLAAGTVLVVLPAQNYSDRDSIQAFINAFRAKCPAVGVFAIGGSDGKALAIASVPDELVARGVDAVKWVKEACGKGGGKPNAAQGGVAESAVSDALIGAAKYAATFNIQ